MDRTQLIKDIVHNVATVRATLGRAGDAASADVAQHFTNEELEQFQQATEQLVLATAELEKGTKVAYERKAAGAPGIPHETKVA